MGVQGLWQVLESTGRPITLNSLDGKRVAIDISLWLCQAAQGYNTYSFGSRAPHIQLLISRIAKLLFYRVHPIFVFDGRNVPALKKQVLNERALRRHMDEIRLSKKQRTMLEQLAKQQLDSTDASDREAAEQELLDKLIRQRAEDRFELPDLPDDLLNKPVPDVNSSGSILDDAYEFDESSDNSSDDDDFLDVTDDEETIKAIWKSVDTNETNDSSAEIDIIELKSTTSDVKPEEHQEKDDLQFLSEQTKDGYLSISQRINMKSLSSQSSSSYFFDAELLWRGQSTPSNKEDAKNNKRKSAPPVVDTKESPQKSAVFHVAGTSEDDWMPESVAETTNSMAPKRQKLAAAEADEPIDNTIVADCQQLLSFLGLPYLIANGEAEAQCVALEQMGLCDGVVTDDSDAWVFGVRHCYRNLFNRKADVQFFDADKISRVLDLDRAKFVAIAMLAGGDYCHGFDGVGCITAIKIIKEIGDAKPQDSSDGENDDNQPINEEEIYGKGLERLQRIRRWLDAKAEWQEKNKRKQFREPKARRKLRKPIETRNEESRIESFPSEEVYSAYMRPDVNKNRQSFKWLPIEFDDLHEFLHAKIGWSEEELHSHTFGALDKWNEFIRQK